MSKRLLAGLLLLIVLGLAAYLRLAHISQNPGWYTDEATHLLIGQQLFNGRSQYLAINQSTLLFCPPKTSPPFSAKLPASLTTPPSSE